MRFPGENVNEMNALEFIGLALPFAADFDAYFYASVNFLVSALVIDSELDNISIMEFGRAGLDVRSRETGVVEERSRGRTSVPDHKLPK
jgi:hypothetical protein